MVETILAGTESCDPVRRTAWGTIVVGEEAELGWLNSSVTVRAAEAFPLDDLLLEIVKQLQGALAQKQAEVAHLKAIGLSEESFGVANLVSSATGPEFSLPSRGKVCEVT